MSLYSRHQLLLILLLVVAAGAGLALDHWRRANPDVVDRVERAAAPAPAAPEARRPARETPERRGALREGPAREAHERGRAPRRVITPSDAPLDVNRASAPELARLPGIGRALAARIVQARPFEAIEDLARVRGLRPATLERVRPRLAVLPLP
jgi:competence protein ComEA